MARVEKVEKVSEVREHLVASAATLVTHYRGLTVKDLKQLRAALRGANAELRIVKNTLARRAATEAGMPDLADLLVGPTGMVFCAEDPVAPAKAIRAFVKDHPQLEIRGGFLDGAVLDAAAAGRLADLLSREELLAKMAGLLQAPMAAMARLMQAPLTQQARLVQALIDKGGAAGESAEPRASAPESPATDVATDAQVVEARASDEASDDVVAAEATGTDGVATDESVTTDEQD